jgi:hypothetical protein
MLNKMPRHAPQTGGYEIRGVADEFCPFFASLRTTPNFASVFFLSFMVKKTSECQYFRGGSCNLIDNLYGFLKELA